MSDKWQRSKARLIMSGRFFKHYHRLPDMKNPVLLDEKLITLYLNRYISDDKVALCSDKLLVREQPGVRRADPGDLFPELYAVWEKASDITLEGLPEKSVIKCNHDCGSVAFIEKSKMTEEKLEALKQDFARKLATPYCTRGQYHYTRIHPKVYAEEFLDAGDGASPLDFKFFCMNGTSRACLVMDRHDHQVKRILVDHDFKQLDYLSEHRMDEDYQQLKPENFERMQACAETVAGEFPFVRVDMYSINGRMVLGEMTFSPRGCLNYHFGMKGQKELGGYLQI